MADCWSHRLVVQGPTKDVAAFRRAATANRTSRSEGSRLSFKRLMRLLPADNVIDQQLLWIEPQDLFVNPASKLEDGMVEMVHGFEMSRGSISPLLVEISRLYPSLCFILGTVFPSGDEQASCFIHNGRLEMWTLPRGQRDACYGAVPQVPDDPSEEEKADEFWAELQADWAAMDAVVDHWVSTAKKTRARIAASRSVAASR
jgi:hypothetical protein